MAEISIEIPETLKKQIEKSNLDVSRAVAESIANELVRVSTLRNIISKSKLSEKDALDLGKEIKSGRFKKLKERGLL